LSPSRPSRGTPFARAHRWASGLFRWRTQGRPNLTALADDPDLAAKTGSAIRLNELADACGAETYLEVGIRDGRTLQAVNVLVRSGVDPFHSVDVQALPPGIFVHTVESDLYFDHLNDAQRFDLIFLDGLHEFRQTYRDILNALSRVSRCGVILVDDVVPSSEAAAYPDFMEAQRMGRLAGVAFPDWMGDVYRAAVAVISLHPEVAVRTLVDHGHRPQMVLWLLDGVVPPSPAGSLALERFGTLSYRDVFASGCPTTFNPSTLADVVLEIRNRRAALG
jgi:predicted O-methyltransferase YrrM